MRLTALDLVRVSGLWAHRVAERGVACRDGSWIVLGPGADENRIATIACRCLVQRALAPEQPGDAEVRELVEEYGYRFTAEKRPRRTVRGTSPRRVKQSA